jgi:murein DD-endopeptidase MepM/ murein hydrolase activator NlpD
VTARLSRQGRGRARSRPLFLIAFAGAILCVAGSVALAQDKSSARRAGSGTLKMKTETARPGKLFFDGTRKANYRYSIGGTKARDVRAQVVRRGTWDVVHSWNRDNVKPGTEQKAHWGGKTKHGHIAPEGAYFFRVKEQGGRPADRKRTQKDDRSFNLYPAKFPVRGKHTFGDGVGAPRAGHVHEGQDVMARCATKLVAARGGRVQYRGNDAGGAGHYIVIDGKKTGRDWMYAHLRKASPLHEGDHVKTGEKIGRVGRTGDATACHLHVEEWSSPGWYQGGHFMRGITKHLKRWDRWS